MCDHLVRRTCFIRQYLTAKTKINFMQSSVCGVIIFMLAICVCASLVIMRKQSSLLLWRFSNPLPPPASLSLSPYLATIGSCSITLKLLRISKDIFSTECCWCHWIPPFIRAFSLSASCFLSLSTWFCNSFDKYSRLHWIIHLFEFFTCLRFASFIFPTICTM